MGIENIIQNILNEANNYANTLLKDAENTSSKIIEEANAKAQQIMNDEEKRIELEKESLKSRMVSSAELQRRKMILSTKQQGITKGFDVALKKLQEMPEDKYISFLVEQIIKIPNCCGTILLNEKDKNKIGEKLVNIINDKLNGQKLTLSDKTINVSGGVILKSGNVEINSTFETLLNLVKDELTNDVANALFN